MHDFTRLRVWDDSMSLTEEIYRVTSHFPKHELYGLTQQVRRAAVSVPSNISEGAYRNSKKEFAHFLAIATGSVGEVFTQIEIAARLEYVDREEANQIKSTCMSIQKMLSKLRYTFLHQS